MNKNQRNLLISVIVLVVVLVGAYVVYQSVMARSSGPTVSYVPQLAIPASERSSSSSESASGAAATVSTTTPTAMATSPEQENPAELGDTPSTADAMFGKDTVREASISEGKLPDATAGVAENKAVANEAVANPSSIVEARESDVVEKPVSAPKVPDLPLTSLDGIETSFDVVRAGRPAVLNFWATWCPSCKRELPILQKAWEELGEDVAFILLSTPDGQRETVAGISDYVAKNGLRAPVYIDDGVFAYIFGVNAIPTTVFINADGTVSGGYLGYVPEDAMLQEIRKLLD